MTTKRRRTKGALAKRDRAKGQLDTATTELHNAIVDDLDDGATQQELKEITGYSRERLRLIAKEVRVRRAEQSG